MRRPVGGGKLPAKPKRDVWAVMTIEPLVLVPPMLCDARVFSPQIDGLSRDCPVMFAPTIFGERTEEIAGQILDWSPPKFALCGMGMGGAVALEVLRRAPDRVTRIALISATAQADTPEQASAREPLIVAARSGRFDDVIRAELDPEWLAPGPLRMHVHGLVADMAHTNGSEAYVRQARAMQRRRDQQRTLRKINQPAVVICGQEDSCLPVRRQQFTAEMIPYGRFEVVAGAGHLPTLEEPAATNIILRDWLKQPLVLR